MLWAAAASEILYLVFLNAVTTEELYIYAHLQQLFAATHPAATKYYPLHLMCLFTVSSDWVQTVFEAMKAMEVQQLHVTLTKLLFLLQADTQLHAALATHW
jgi:hypothetical protein